MQDQDYITPAYACLPAIAGPALARALYADIQLGTMAWLDCAADQRAEDAQPFQPIWLTIG
ncbi:MAG TPA: hypothetical protein VE136_18650 [Anaerolineales bacterium]|nr:hypothetical protein [Anaerolineales bacterium]